MRSRRSCQRREKDGGRTSWHKAYGRMGLSSGLIPQEKNTGVTDKNVADYGQVQMYLLMIEEFFLMGVEKTELFSLMRIYLERED